MARVIDNTRPGDGLPLGVNCAQHYEPWDRFEVGFLHDYNMSHELAIWVRIAMVVKESIKRHPSVNKRDVIGLPQQRAFQ